MKISAINFGKFCFVFILESSTKISELVAEELEEGEQLHNAGNVIRISVWRRNIIEELPSVA